MNCRRRHTAACSVSMLAHGALFAGLLIGQMNLQQASQGRAAVALDLAMFQVESHAPAPSAGEAPAAPVEQAPRPPQTQDAEAPAQVTPQPPQPVRAAPPTVPAPAPQPAVRKTPVAEPPPRPAQPVAAQPQAASPEPVQTAMAASELRPPPTAAAQQRAAPDHGLIASLEDAYRAALRQAIEANKFYPKRASRMRREGSVIVDFSVDRDGRIRDVRVHRSSGTQMLDQAAVEAVRRLGRFRPIPEEIPRDLWSLQIPMDYKLL